MIAYIDRQLRVDPSRTYAALDWRPTPRLDVQRRLLLMIEHLKSQRETWEERNAAALHRVAQRPHLVIAEVLEDLREILVARIVTIAVDPANAQRFCDLHLRDHDSVVWLVRLLYQVLIASVRTRDRQILRNFAQIMAMRRKQEGIAAQRLQNFLGAVSDLVCERLREERALAGMDQAIHDHVSLCCQLAVDGVEDTYAALDHQLPETLLRYRGFELPTTTGDLERLVHQLEDLGVDQAGFPLQAPR